MADLTGVRAKLRRADEHRQAYDDLFESYLETQPYSILFEFDPETGCERFESQDYLDRPVENGGEAARFRTESRLDGRRAREREPALSALVPDGVAHRAVAARPDRVGSARRSRASSRPFIVGSPS